MFPQYSSTVLIKYCTFKALWKNYRELLLEFYFIFTLLNSYSLFKLFKYPPVQTAIVHTVQHWQVFTKVEQRHPRHLILIFFSFSPLGSCIHLCFSVAFYQSLQRCWKPFNKWEKCVFKSNVGGMTAIHYCATCSERVRQRGWHLFLCHTLSFFSVFNFSSSLNLFLFLWLNQGVMTLWQLHKKAGFKGEVLGSCQVGAEQGVFARM